MAKAAKKSVMNERFAFDLAAAGDGACGLVVAGADEAGRGCLAGPLVMAAVCFDYAAFDGDDYEALTALDDSKRLTRQRREELYGEILCRARQIAVVCCSHTTIDQDGLHRCNLAGLASALESLDPSPGVAFVDGFPLPACSLKHEAVVGGDHRSAAVAAASVIAKVTRDRLMRTLHQSFPEYGFDRHVGYATSDHQAAIRAHGVCGLHRRSFQSVAYQQLGIEFDGPSADI